MKRLSYLIGFLMIGAILITSCGPKPQYKTALGKKKMKYYNNIQHGNQKPKSFKSFRKEKH